MTRKSILAFSMLVILNNLHNLLRFSVSSLMLYHDIMTSPKPPEITRFVQVISWGGGSRDPSQNGDVFFPRHVWWKSWTARFVPKKMADLHLQSYSHTFWGGVSLDLLWKDPPKSLLQNKVQTPHKALKWKNSEKWPGQDPLSVYPSTKRSQTKPSHELCLSIPKPSSLCAKPIHELKEFDLPSDGIALGQRIKKRLKCTRKQLT